MAKILVIGAGAVGGYFGARLSKAGHDVTFLAKERHLKSINANGLQIKSVDGDFRVNPKVIASVAGIESPDIIVLATKCYDALPAVESVKSIIGKQTILLTLLNGLGVEDRLVDLYGDVVLPGIVVITARLSKPGVIEHFARGFITVGEFNGLETVRLKSVVELLSRAGIKTSITHDVVKAKWKKLCWNATFNPLSVIVDRPVRVILSSQKCLKLIIGAIEEIISVAHSEGVDLPADIAKETIELSVPLRDYHTSMWEDLHSGKGSELLYFNGEVIRRGKSKGIKVPYNKALLAMAELCFQRG